MALTDQDKQDLLNALKADSLSMDELTTVTSLDGINSLPAMKDGDLVSAPVSLLATPAIEAAHKATDAATTARSAATTAQNAATTAQNAATKAGEAATTATTAADNAKTAGTVAKETAQAAADKAVKIANDAATEAKQTATDAADAAQRAATEATNAAVRAQSYEPDILLAREGASARFDSLVEGVTIQQATTEAPEAICYDTVRKQFCAKAGDVYYADWVRDGNTHHELLYMDTSTHAPRQDKAFISGSAVYVWSQEEANLVEISGAGKGSLTAITLNGQRFEADEEGNVTLTVDETEVDASLDADSTNPVENRVVAAKLSEMEAHTLGALEVVPDGDDNYLYAYDLKGKTIAQTKLPAGGGGGTSQTSRILITAAVSAQLVGEGGDCRLTYTYDHVNAEGESDGVKATITVTVRLGTTTLLTTETRNVSRGTYTLDLTPYTAQAGNIDVYVRAACTTAEGEAQTKQAYAAVTVASLALSSTYDVSQGIARGGYTAADTIEIPFALTGSGTRTVSMYVDGETTPVTKTVTKAGTTRDSFTLQAASLSVGRHSVQIVAEREGLRSAVIWIDLIRRGDSPLEAVAMMASIKSGQIVTGSMPITPQLEANQYDSLSFAFAAYSPQGTPATVTVRRTQGEHSEENTITASRSRQTYSCRFMEQGTATVSMSVGGASLSMGVEVGSSGIEVAEATLGQQLRLTASGRSNAESRPDEWTSNGVRTVFEDVDWATSGWTGTALLLRNGARATVDYRPFAEDVKAKGCTIEVEMMVRGIRDHEATVVSAMDGGKGFRITTESAALYSGSTIDREDEENTDPDTGKPLVNRVPVGVESKFSEGVRVRIAFVVRTKADGALMELYMNGDRCGAMCYQSDDNFKQTSPQGITLSSEGADLYVYSIRAYSRALDDDELVDNYIVGQDTADDIAALYTSNNVLADETGDIDLSRIISRGRAAIFIVRTEDSGNGLDDVNACKNKKQNFHVDEMTIYTPWGDTYRATDVMMRIQGTSSTKYPVKNYRFYWAKTAHEGATPMLYRNGEPVSKNKLPLFEGDTHPCKISCAKADFSDSSMKTNTGMACLFNDVLRTVCPVPPQQEDRTVRTAIYGYPCDIFAATSADEAHPTFYGQYQMNNDKSDWYEVTGMTDTERHIALEFLDNGKRLCNFQTDEDLDAQLAAEFDSSFEFNYPKDTFWAGADTAAGELDASDYQKTAIKTMLQWVRACVPTGADLTCTDLTTWKSTKFTTELADHFSLQNLLTWYLLTEYFAMVDQRAKNTIWRTWDGVHWYVTYYDGDTMLGKRNDSLLAYLYNVSRTSWDTEKKKWVFEGHDSWLWCLLLANCEAELRTAAETLRRQLTNTKVLTALDNIEQNWSRREYNRSGYMKYIRPETEGVRVTENGVTTDGNRFYYMYALSGTRSMQLTHFITRRFALLDARLGVSNYRADSAGFYLAREASDPADRITITSADEYYFAYGLSGKDYMEGETGCLMRGEKGTLSVTGKRALNDPMLLFGASRILCLDMTGAASHLLNGLELGACTALTTLDLSVPTGAEPSKTTWWLVTDGATALTSINLSGQTGARSNRQDSSSLDFSSQTQLRSLDARGTRVKSILLAEGAPITTLHLPATLTALRLSHLPRLKADGLTYESLEAVETFVFDSCPGLDWQTLLNECPAVSHLRITGIDMDGDGTLLTRYAQAGGVDENGEYTDTCALVGTYRLSRFLDDDTYNSLAAHYPDLNILQPQFTTISLDDSVADPANVSNHENMTGYLFDTPYEPSGHITRILAQRHRVLMKQTAAGEVTVCPLCDTNSLYFADQTDPTNPATGTAATLDGTQGDVMMYEPHYWQKGINDYRSQRKYAAFSSLDVCPEAARHVRLTRDELTFSSSSAMRVSTEYATLAEALVTADGYATAHIPLATSGGNWRQVRFPAFASAIYGAVMADESGNILARISVGSASNIKDGEYIFASVPQGAASIDITVKTEADFDYVLLTEGTAVADIEPDWLEHPACLTGVYQAQVADDILRSITDGKAPYKNLTADEYELRATTRATGFHLVDYQMHRDVAWLFFARYGNRDSMLICGAGAGNNDRVNGRSNDTGMTDTTSRISDDLDYPHGNDNVHAYVFKKPTDTNRSDIQSPVVMGYENWHSHNGEFMHGITCHEKTVDYIWRIASPYEPSATPRTVQQDPWKSGVYPTVMVHGRHMDLIPRAEGGSTSTYYADNISAGGATGQDYFRAGYNANQQFGLVSITSQKHGTGYYMIGTRLGYRGTIRTEASPTRFLALPTFA